MTEPFSGREQAAAARDFAAQLRWWRSVRGYSQGRLAQRMPHSEAMIAKVESGERWPTEDLARRCDEVLQTGGALAGLWPAVRVEQQASDGRRRRRRDADGGSVADARRLLSMVLADTNLSATHPFVREALAALDGADN
ncbi:helix-turn-helix transcriptional regulator [Catellatospora sp. NPDC049609]|uniref:helix-turn-helix domain-containing protein n=1 Tax=Catellatospora sp. NPDC049609 TaxID=3155505 RepID=UPI0034248F5B